MAVKKVKPKVGDVFCVPISEEECGFGQILAKYKGAVFLMVVFSQKARSDAHPAIEEIISSPPLFVSNSFDAKIWHGDWPIIGNVPPDLARLPLPKYKVQIGQEMHVESYDATRARPATQSELGRLTFRTCVSPILLELALKAHWGFGEWEESFDCMKAEAALQSACIEV
jgi:hypothetical protein